MSDSSYHNTLLMMTLFSGPESVGITRFHCNRNKTIIALYIDDILTVDSNINEINAVISLLFKEFDTLKLESVSEFLIIWMKVTPNNLIMDQESYTIKLLNKFNMLECKPRDILNSPKSIPSDFKIGKKFNDPYHELIGCLSYGVSRPDILYGINYLKSNTGITLGRF